MGSTGIWVSLHGVKGQEQERVFHMCGQAQHADASCSSMTRTNPLSAVFPIQELCLVQVTDKAWKSPLCSDRSFKEGVSAACPAKHVSLSTRPVVMKSEYCLD